MKTKQTYLLRKVINKQNYDLRINTLSPQATKSKVIIAKEIIWSKSQMQDFENYMMQDIKEIEELDLYYHPELQAQEVAWIHEKGKKGGWYVDNQGYSYARYVGKA